MEPDDLGRRRERRYELAAGATVVLHTNGQAFQAKTENMSASGIFLRFEEPVQLAVGEEVTCDFYVTHKEDRPLPYWGIGNVVRVEGRKVAIELHAGGLSQAEFKANEHAALG
jgi:hypothetical protein